MLREADAEAQAIVEQAEQQAEALLEQERSRAEQAAQSIEDRLVRRAQEKRSRRLNQARVEALEIIGQARQALVQQAFDRISEQLKQVRKHDYSQVLARLLDETLQALEDSQGPLTLRADPRDRSLLTELLTEREAELQVDYDLECLGGVAASTADGRIGVTNTLDSRLERARRALESRLGSAFQEQAESRLEPA